MGEATMERAARLLGVVEPERLQAWLDDCKGSATEQVLAAIGELAMLRVEHDRRVTELLAANNSLVEKRRAMAALLREALSHWDDRAEYHDLYHSIETLLSEIHA